MTKIGIIGGSGFENPGILDDPDKIWMETPYGEPSSDFYTGKINGVDVVTLSRHDRHHTISPTGVNNQANIWALKELGCTQVLATTACGSLREEIDRGHLVILDQFIDFTRHRKITYFDKFKPNELKHTPMAGPFSNTIRRALISTGQELNLPIHEKGTVITIEGPRFSTRAESKMFRMWGADVINMSTAPEVILANEIGLPYAAVAMSTDYDCWKEDETPVSWEDVLKVFKSNVKNVVDLIVHAVPKIAAAHVE